MFTLLIVMMKCLKISQVMRLMKNSIIVQHLFFIPIDNELSSSRKQVNSIGENRIKLLKDTYQSVKDTAPDDESAIDAIE